MNLSDTSVLITGGSRGLGLALGRAFGGAGARVVLVARGKEALDERVAALRTAGVEAHGIAADVSDPEAASAIAGQAAALIGPIEVAVMNASSLGRTPMPLLLDTEDRDLAQVFETNLLGPFRLIKALAGPMALRQRGVVVAVSSDAAVEPYPGWGAYAASKAALDHLTRIWAAELAGTGVRFFSVDPGEMDTEMHAAAIPDADRSTLADPDDVAAQILAMVESAERAPTGARLVAEPLEAPR